MEEEHEASTRLHLHAKIHAACTGWGGKKPLRVLCVLRRMWLRGWRREATGEAGRFGGSLDAVASTSSAVLGSKRGGHGLVSLEEDATLLAQQQTISSSACASVAPEIPFLSDAAPARERGGGRARVAEAKILPS